MKWVILKPSLVFNWVKFLGVFSAPLTVIQTISLYSKFSSFLVQILIRKDNKDNKVFKWNLIQKEQERKEKDKVWQLFVQFAGNLSERVSGKQSSLNLSIFLFFFFFFFFCFIEKFQSSLKFESFLRFFSAEFLVEFSFSWIFLVELQKSIFIYFYFYFMGSSIHEASNETHLLA